MNKNNLRSRKHLHRKNCCYGCESDKHYHGSNACPAKGKTFKTVSR